MAEGAMQKSNLIKEQIRKCNAYGGNLVVYDALSYGLEFDCVVIRVRTEVESVVN